MATAEKESLTKKEPSSKNNNDDVSTFLSDLNTAINFRSSSRSGRRDAINRFYYTIGSTNILLEQNLDVENISERSINKIPHCQNWQEGIISVRGAIIPVINMRKFLQGKINIGEDTEEESKENRLLLLNHEEHSPIILLIEKLPEMVNIKNYSTEKAPSNSPDWFTNDFVGDELSLIEVDHNKLLKEIIKEQ